MRTLLLLPILALLTACGGDTSKPAEGTAQSAGEVIFHAQCAMCHGRTGNLGLNGAKDLTKSKLSKEEVIAVVTNGRNAMMPYKSILSPEQVKEVADHVLTLRTKG